MNPVIYIILIYILLGGVGMYVASKKVDAVTSRARWLKFITYILIVLVMIACIRFHLFYIPAAIIVCFGWYEIARTVSLQRNVSLVAFALFILIASAFLVFAFRAIDEFQFFVYFQVLSFDAFCQVTGQLFGKNKIAPVVSPSKTWEGLAGGFIFCILSSVVAYHDLQLTFLDAVELGLITAIIAFIGDMLASWYKRKCDIKDYSNFLPGQGGFLDRFDSLMMVSAFYVVLYLLKADFIQPYFIE